jgi:hypothetical protein
LIRISKVPVLLGRAPGPAPLIGAVNGNSTAAGGSDKFPLRRQAAKIPAEFRKIRPWVVVQNRRPALNGKGARTSGAPPMDYARSQKGVKSNKNLSHHIFDFWEGQTAARMI